MKMMWLFLSFIGLLCLADVAVHIYHFYRNLAFAQKLDVLEELMDSKLRCVLGMIGIGIGLSRSCVKIAGTYRGKRISFSSHVRLDVGFSAFRLKSTELPPQKMLMLKYPTVAENVAQVGNTLVRFEEYDFLSEETLLERDGAIKILDGLVDTAERLEAADS